MPIDVLMPALSPTMEKGTLSKWLKKEGDAVKSGDVLAEIETDKATMEVEAVDEGVLARIVVPEGTADVPVNDLIAVIAAEGEDPGSVEAPAKDGGAGGASKPEAKAAPSKSAGAKSDGSEPEASTGKGQTSYARADEAPDAAKAVNPEAEGGAAPGPESGGTSGRPFSSPLARRLAKMEGIDLASIEGSGPRGRVIARDVTEAKAAGTGKAAPAAKAEAAGETVREAPKDPSTDASKGEAKPAPKAAAPAGNATQGMTAEQVKALFEAGSYEEIQLDGMRKTIARRLVESKQTVPHFYLSLDVELDALLALRGQVNAGAPKDKEGKPAFKLSVNDFVIKAMALALQRVPDANAVWAGDRILKFRHADVGVAVAIEGGLFTPVIRRAEQKTLSTISAEMKDLAARARTRKLKPEEYAGGSTAVSNLGMFGIRSFQAVINPPHATILAVGGGEARVVAKDGQPAVVQAMTVTLSVDHRVVDGALGAQLLQAFKGLIESPMAMLV